MRAVLLSVHVLAAVLCVGPVTVAASMFPRVARAAATAPTGRGVAATLHRICRVYSVVGIFVPVFGLATAAAFGVLGSAWLVTSIVLTLAAAVLLVAAVLPAQRRVLAAPAAEGTEPVLRRLGMTTGLFALLWAVVTVLMIVRPGSTTGV